MRVVRLKHSFVKEIPPTLDQGMLYVSLEYGTAVHLCCCGCDNEIVTPLTPTDWRIIYDGETISVDPSVGNWSLPCRSHYIIRRGKIRWASSWTEAEIADNRASDRLHKRQFFDARRSKPTAEDE